MKSALIPVGTHVVYDRYESNNYHAFTEAYVFAVRPKGNKSNYWGGKTGNADTIGIAYVQPWHEKETGGPVWSFTWTRPQNIHYLWDDYVAIKERTAKREAEQRNAAAIAKAEWTAVWAALPQIVRDAVGLSEWGEESMLGRGYCNIQLTPAVIKRIADAAVQHSKRNSPESVQAEVDAALRLLA